MKYYTALVEAYLNRPTSYEEGASFYVTSTCVEVGAEDIDDVGELAIAKVKSESYVDDYYLVCAAVFPASFRPDSRDANPDEELPF